MSETLTKLGGYVVQGVDYADNLSLEVGSGINATFDEENKKLILTNDETVLFSGTSVTTTGTAITLSEPYTNFEYLDVYGHWNATLKLGNINYNSHIKVDTENQDNFSLYVLADGGGNAYESNSFWTLSSNSAILKCAYYRNVTSTAFERNTSFNNIDKIVGINRKS